jgi:hypothetical protein
MTPSYVKVTDLRVGLPVEHLDKPEPIPAAREAAGDRHGPGPGPPRTHTYIGHLSVSSAGIIRSKTRQQVAKIEEVLHG